MSEIASSGFYKISQRRTETEIALEKSPKFTTCVSCGWGDSSSNFLVRLYRLIVGVLGKFGSLESYTLITFEQSV